MQPEKLKYLDSFDKFYQMLVNQGKEEMSRGGKGLSTSDKPCVPHNTRNKVAEELGWAIGKVQS